jgi:uncharacterized membrane protein
MSRPISTVLIEAIVIGIMNATLFWSLNQIGFVIPKSVLLTICGALIHIIFEYTGGNEWWCRQTYKCP